MKYNKIKITFLTKSICHVKKLKKGKFIGYYWNIIFQFFNKYFWKKWRWQD